MMHRSDRTILVVMVLTLLLGTSAFAVDENSLVVAPSEAAPGTTMHKVDIIGLNVEDVAGYTIVLDYNKDYVEAVDVNLEDTLAEAVGAEFVSYQDYDEEGFFVFGVLLDLEPPYEHQVIPAVPELELIYANFICNIKPAAADVDEVLLQFIDDVGDPPVRNMFVVGVSSVQPLLIPGAVTIIADAPFIRGELNHDGMLDIADAVSLLTYLAYGEPQLTCLDAGDTNDDGLLDTADAVYELTYMFQHGSPIPAPFPTLGVDPTEDDLGCEE